MPARPLISLDPSQPGLETGIEDAAKAYKELEAHRDIVAGKYDEAIGFAYPGRRGIKSSPDQNMCFDDTAVVAAQEFASRIQAGVVPNFSRWASHIAGVLVQDPEERKEVDDQLQQVDEFIFQMVNSSNFQTEVNEAFQDLAVGTMGFSVEEGDEANPLVCQAIPLGELLYGTGPDGRPDPIARERELSIRDIKTMAPMATLGSDLAINTKHRVVEIWQRDWSEPAAHRYRCTWFLPGKENRVIWQYDTRGMGSRKMTVTRWSKSSGEVWGRGPLLTCLPSMRTVNFAMKAVIDHADIALAGVWSGEDDGIFNAETVVLEPGVIIPRAPGSQPLQNVAPGQGFDIQQFLIEEHRTNIKKALFTEQLGNPNKTPMSATEVDQRMAELSRAIGAPFGRIVLEFVVPFIERAVYILKRRKLIELPEVDGKEIKLIPTSPLAQGQRFDDIDRTTKYIGTLTQLFGPEAAALTVDTTEASIYLGERFGVPERITRSRKAQEALSAQIAEAQGGMAVDGGNAAEGEPVV